jgi:glycosyltransferase involved in cell wall biosynthesis
VLLDRELHARGHQTLLVHGSVGDDEASSEPLAVASRIRMLKIPALGRRLRLLGDVSALLQLLGLIFRESPDVVHTHTAKAGTLGRIAAFAFNATHRRSRRCLVVHTFHGNVFQGYFSPAISRLIRLWERSLSAITDCIIAISPVQRREIVDRFKIAGNGTVTTIALGLNLETLLSLSDASPGYRQELAVGAREVVIGYVGRMAPIKDLPTLIRAFGLALRTSGGLQLLLAGDGAVRREIEGLSRELGIAARVHFLGWIDDLPRLYATMDICALASLNEGTPVAIIEAMAAGKAVVATAVGGVADVVEDGITGILVPSHNVEALAAALVRLAHDPEKRQQMGATARRRAAEAYSSNRLVNDVERLYADRLAAKRR